MKRIYVNEEWCLGCHLCEYECMYANSGLDAMFKLKGRLGEFIPRIKVEGDDTILADTLRSVVKRCGDQGKSVVFHDFNMSGSDWTHRMMITAPEYTAMIYDIMTADDWKVPGVHYVNGTTLKDWDKIRKLKQ